MTTKTLTNLAVLTRTVEDLQRAGIVFDDELDDLGPARTAHITIGERQFILDHIDGSPDAGVVAALLAETTDPVSDLADLLARIGVPSSAVSNHWDGKAWVEGPPGYRLDRPA